MKKGFTLIELLAVIVILAIIALIAIPQITNVVENAKKEAGARSVEGHVESINTELAKKMLLGNDLSDGEYSFSSLDVKIKGNTTCTSYTLKSNTVISASNCEANGYTYSYNMESGAYILAGSKGSKTSIYASYNGRLHVEGSKLMNSKNQEFRLTGASYGNGTMNANVHEYSLESLATLKSWGANLFRVFIDGIPEWSSAFTYIGNEENFLKYYYQAVDNAIKNDMYVIVTWASHGVNGDPMVNNAIDALTRVAKKYPNDPHIIYEIWNEPALNKTWSDIKEYSNQVIPKIREISPDSVILVGTPLNDARPDLAINDQLNFNNIMYTHHTYVNTMHDSFLSYMKKAIDAGLPIFETEWSSNPVGTPTGYENYETHATSFAKILAKYNISYAVFCFHASQWSYSFVEKGKWNSKLPENTLTPNGKFFKKILKSNYNYEGHLMKGNGNNNSVGGVAYRSTEWRDKIKSIEFKNKLSIPSNAVVSWDLSPEEDNSVVGYLIPIDNSNLYKLVISANGYINAPIDSKYLFAGMTNLESIDFANFKTVYVNSMTNMFLGDTNLTSLDLSSFDTRELKNISGMFQDCTNLESINFNNWSPKLDNIFYEFSNCTHLKKLDLSGFNVQNVSKFDYLFYRNLNLTNLNISTWNPNTVATISKMFASCSSLEKIDMSSFVIDASTNVTQALNNVKANVNVVVKNQTVVDYIKDSANNTVNFEIKG